MDNWLIFQYHHRRAHTQPKLLREALRGLPTHLCAVSKGVTEEGSRTHAMVDVG